MTNDSQFQYIRPGTVEDVFEKWRQMEENSHWDSVWKSKGYTS